MKDNTCGLANKITFHYTFRFRDGKAKEFPVTLDKSTLNVIRSLNDSYPEWTALGYVQCPHCSLDKSKHNYCPIAVNLCDLVQYFRNSKSYEEVDVVIETEERTYIKHTTMQKGLSSLFGIYMVTSGCPVMEKLKPMVRYHLPFATEEETKYRVLSMYLLAQYFLHKRGKHPDWELKNLIDIYEGIHIINKNISKRLSGINVEDASVNALVILDTFADSIAFSLTEDMLDEIKILFNAYF
jgi:glutaredoxin